ncbi:protein RecA [Firmicutes bacterium CAG:552]|jgi:recombination protein RecA|nr:MAG: recombinase RecA [Firmicutes bacterium CAG:552_39_19]CDB26895.1 protein RecA [Firmicutes bacterium CAG:552]
MEKKEKKELSDKEKALEAAISQIEKSFGKGAIMRLGETALEPVEVISTGCLPLDIALGIGGLPRGRIVEIYGPESSGKTTISLHVIAQAQKSGGTVAFIDAEHALDPIYAKRLGIDISRLYISQPDNGEQALEITEELVRSGAMDVIVIDSVAALTPKVEIDGEMGDSHVGAQARLMSQALRKLTGVCSKTKTCIIFINQLREKVGVMFGNPEVTTGGKALKFYASVRLDVRKGEPVKSGSEVIGCRTKVKVVKNKMAPPFRTAEFEMIFGKGISRPGTLLDMAVEYGIIEKSGSWYTYNDERIGERGRDNVVAYLDSQPALCDEIEAKIRQIADSKNEFLVEGVSSESDDESLTE